MNEQNQDELARTIVQEFKSSDRSRWSGMTLKDVLVSIHRNVSALEVQLRYAPMVSEAARNSAIVVLCVVCSFITLFVASNRDEIAFIAEHAVELMAFALMAGALALLLFIEAIPLVQTLLKSVLCRIAIGFFFAMAVVTSTGSANTAVNAALGVDASNAPIARALLTGALVMKAGWWIAAVLGFMALLQGMLLATKLFKGEGAGEFSFQNASVIVCTVLLGWAYSAVLFRGFHEAALPDKAYVLAQRYDLNDRALCLENQLAPEQYAQFKYLFIGSQQQEVLIVPRMETGALNASFFTRADNDIPFERPRPVTTPCNAALPRTASSAPPARP